MRAQTQPLQTLPEPQAEFIATVTLTVDRGWWLAALAAIVVLAGLTALWWCRRRPPPS